VIRGDHVAPAWKHIHRLWGPSDGDAVGDCVRGGIDHGEQGFGQARDVQTPVVGSEREVAGYTAHVLDPVAPGHPGPVVHVHGVVAEVGDVQSLVAGQRHAAGIAAGGKCSHDRGGGGVDLGDVAAGPVGGEEG